MIRFLLNIIISLLPLLLMAQNSLKVHIEWSDMLTQKSGIGSEFNYFTFNGATNLLEYGALPVSVTELEPPPEYLDYHIFIKPILQDTLSAHVTEQLTDIDLVSEANEHQIRYVDNRVLIYVLPFSITESGQLTRLVDFEIFIELVPEAEKVVTASTGIEYTSTSVLSEGTWYKMGILNTGVHKLSYQDLIGFGIDPSQIDPGKIGIFGNYSGMLPEGNHLFRFDDLHENAIEVVGEQDGEFNEEDYILFYAQSATTWRYNIFTQRFDHYTNIYADTIYYFLTTDSGTKIRIQNDAVADEEPTEIVQSFYDFNAHENDLESLMYSGKQWYGERFTGDTMERTFPFYLPNLKKDRPVYLNFEMVARGFVNTYAEVYVNNVLVIDSTKFVKVSASSAIYASRKNRTVTFFVDSDHLNVKVKYYSDDPTAIAWLDFLEINAERDMFFSGGQMSFRNPHVGATGNITKFQLNNVSENVRIWNMTNRHQPYEILYSLNNSQLEFTLPTDSLLEFITFDGSVYYKPVIIEPIENQNLHGISDLDFLIVAPSMFMEQAERLADLHEKNDGLKTVVVTPEIIYNEFSSGSQDVSAIRDFVRMLWKTGAYGNDPGYLLLFGDASFDYKHRIHENTNIVPTYQSDESLRETKSYVTDDFFGLLDDDEGVQSRGDLDIGIGRFPVSTLADAKVSVDKIEHYLQNNKDVMRPWRNTICFIADDADHNLHLHQAKYLISTVDTLEPNFNLNKIFSDAYTKVKVPGGKRFPEVNDKIINQVENGALIVNYTGHGGLIGWSEEIILDVPTIRSFENIDNMPLFITATCEFSRFDNPEFVSAGEYLYLNENGGAIALLTTTRLAFAAANIIVNQRIYTILMEREDGERPRLGDMVRLSKIPSNDNFLNFALLGDPALRLAYPQHNVVTNTVNDKMVNQLADTVNALSLVTVSGSIEDQAGNKIEHFNGYVYPKIFDKDSEYMTLGTETDSSPEEFSLMDRILFNGKSSVINGEFEFSFMVPKDITYRYGFGKISYYAVDTSIYTDAWGAYNQLYIGGLDSQYEPDNTGPDINLYLNETSFESGDEVPPDSYIIADLSDQHGIHSTGQSLGRDITLVMDNDLSNTLIMNDYFTPEIDSYKGGSISYLFENIPDGWHTFTLKAWDLQNNSSESTVEFYVDENAAILLSQVMNYPNPFADETYFGFIHNKNGSTLDVNIKIYDIQGRYVTQIEEKVNSTGSLAVPIKWDGKDHNGNPMPSGLYPYHLIVTDYTGNQSIQKQKMIKWND